MNHRSLCLTMGVVVGTLLGTGCGKSFPQTDQLLESRLHQLALGQLDPRSILPYLQTHAHHLSTMHEALWIGSGNDFPRSPEGEIARYLIWWGSYRDAYWFLELSRNRRRYSDDLEFACRIAAELEDPALLPDLTQKEIQQLFGRYEVYSHMAKREYEAALTAFEKLPQVQFMNFNQMYWKSRILRKLGRCQELDRFLTVEIPGRVRRGASLDDCVRNVGEQRDRKLTVFHYLCLALHEGYRCNADHGRQPEARYLRENGRKLVALMSGDLWWDRFASQLFQQE